MNDSRTVLILQMLSFLTYSLGSNKVAEEKDDGRPITPKLSFTFPRPQQLAGWAALTFILLVAADLESTSELASAMALLILISVMITYGETLFTRLSNTVKG